MRTKRDERRLGQHEEDRPDYTAFKTYKRRFPVFKSSAVRILSPSANRNTPFVPLMPRVGNTASLSYPSHVSLSIDTQFRPTPQRHGRTGKKAIGECKDC